MKSIVHIGANKTASTLLQRRLFADHPAIAYLGEDCRDYASLRPTLETLIQQDESYYDEAATQQLFTRTAVEANRNVMVFSSEDILTARHPSVVAARLGRLMPGATVVLVLRNQLTTWPSWYINHGAYLKGVPRRYWRRHVGFAEWLDHCFAFPDQTPVEAMNYQRHAEIFRRVFGKENVRVLLYEDLIRRPADYFHQWGELLGLPAQDLATRLEGKRERPRNSQRRFRFDAWRDRAPMILGPLATLLGPWLERGAPAHADLPAGWSGRIRAYYAAGNTALAQAYHLDLASYGYPVL